jgi:hypothetical protein
MEIAKSTRHSKITGDFGEKLVLYWLSKHGFECALVDHTGIDIIARNPHNDQLMGISVKSRCRTAGCEQDYISIPNPEFEKAEAACKSFGCLPYFAIVVDAGDSIRVFVMSLEVLQRHAPMRKLAAGWKMTNEMVQRYASDPAIMTFEFKSRTTRWW